MPPTVMTVVKLNWCGDLELDEDKLNNVCSSSNQQRGPLSTIQHSEAGFDSILNCNDVDD